MSGKVRILLKTKEDLIKKSNKARKDKNFKVLANVQKELGDLYFEIKQHNNALEAYKEQLQLCKNLGEQLNCAVAHRMIGEVYADEGNFQEALKHQALYLEIAEDLDNLIEIQRAYATLGRTYLLIADYLANDPDEDKKKEALKNSKSNFKKSIKACDNLENKINNLEWQTMKARLLLNLGLVLEQQKDSQKALECMECARSTCETNKINDDTLYRINISLSNHYERLGDIETAFKNLDDASKVKDEDLRHEAEFLKAELFLRLGKWSEAKKVLRKLYKYSKMLDPLKDQVIRLLKIVILLCRTEDELLVQNSTSVREKLYEKMGDAAVAVKAWDKAIDYYSNMLSCAEETRSSQLGPALSSLFQTLRDAGRVKESIPYARRELELCKKKGNSKDACNSALFLTSLLTEAECPRKEIREMFDESWNLAKESQDTNLERLVIRDFVEFLEKDNDLDIKQIERLNKRMEDLPCSQSSEEFETETESMEIGADINLDELSDDSDGSFREPRRRRLTCRKKKPNELGETELHVACIKGDEAAVEKLLEQNHPVNVRDFAGWAPLHEASNHGFVEIVRMLIKAGADLDVTEKDEQITPLHDAATNGHISVMHMLLDNGANPNLLTRSGEDVLQCLINWKERAQNLSEQDIKEYNLMKQRLKEVIKVKRHKKRTSNERRNAALYSDDDEEDNDINSGKTLDNWSKPTRISAGEDYKKTIQGLKHPGRIIRQPTNPPPLKITAPLIDSEEMLVDPWLEDDIGKQRKDKPYFSGLPPGIPSEPPVKRKSKDSDLDLEKELDEKKLKRKKLLITKQPSDSVISINEESCDSVLSDYSCNNIYEPDMGVELWPTRKKGPKQTNLLKQGYVKKVKSSSLIIGHKSPSPITPAENDWTFQDMDFGRPIEKVNSWEGISEIDVTISVECEQFNLKLHSKDLSKTLSSIENIIRHQFESRTGCRPRIKFQTLDGVLLDENVTLTEIPGDQNRLSLIGYVVENDLPDVVDRYIKICENLNVDPSDMMLNSLKSLRCCDRTSTFTLNPDCDREELEPLLKCLHYQKNIKVMNLSSAYFDNRGELLNYALKGLTNLTELHLQNCGIHEECLESIEKLPKDLRVLDLAYNPLGIGGKGHKKLFKLIEPLNQLLKLNLSSCHLEKFEDNYFNSSIIDLDISWNPMDGESALNLLQKQLMNLNLSNTRKYSASEKNVIDKIFFPTTNTINQNNYAGFSLHNLDSLVLIGCEVTDLDVAQILSQTPNLMRINLSGNENVTKESLHLMLKRKPTMTYINLHDCRLIKSLPENNLRIISPQCCELRVSMSPDVVGSWEKLWLGRVKVKKLPMNLYIFEPS